MEPPVWQFVVSWGSASHLVSSFQHADLISQSSFPVKQMTLIPASTITFVVDAD
jgi:hypothetical protein